MGERVCIRIRTDTAVVTGRVEGSRPAPARNLSTGGIFLITAQRFGLGCVELLTLEVGHRRLQTPARVTHLQPDGVGFSFASPGEPFLTAVRELIDELLSSDAERTAERKHVSDPVVWSQAGASRTTVLRDLSAGGAFVLCDAPPRLGSELLLYLPGYTYSAGTEQPSELRGCRAQVVRHAEGGFACRFLDPSAEFRMGIALCLARS